MGELHPADRPGAAALKREKNLVIMGSGALIQSLSRAGLIDEYLLTIHPLVLGEGRRLFPPGFRYTELTLTSAKPSTTDVIIATYRLTDLSTHCRPSEIRRSNAICPVSAAESVGSGRGPLDVQAVRPGPA